jgi:hypothetical protein
MLQGAHEVASGMETKGVPQHERNPKMLKAMLFTGMLAAGLLGGASFAGANEPGRWNSAPYIAVAPLITSSDQDISAAIDQITTFPTVLDPRLWDGYKLRARVE